MIRDTDVAVALSELDRRIARHAIVVDPHDKVDETLLPAHRHLFKVADAANDLGVGERLAEQKAGILLADLLTDPVPEVTILVAGAVRLLLREAEAVRDELRQIEAGRAGEP